MLETSCAFTGHRPQKLPWRYNESDDRCVRLKKELLCVIRQLAENGVTDFYSGMADGTDCWAAQSVLSLKWKYPSVRLHCLLPCEGQELKWSADAQARYRGILSLADTVTYVSREYSSGCMLKRDRRLVESAGILLAVYGGNAYRSGTAATIRYAQAAGRKIIVIDPATARVTALNT